MPPKRPSKKQIKPAVAILTPVVTPEIGHETDDPNEPDEYEDEEPEYVMPVAKERYEYNPVLETTIIYIHKNNRVTSEVMSLFEYTECVSQRAKQLENDSRVRFTDTSGITDCIAMAKKELADKRCPLAIRRQLHDNIYELWRTSEMVVPFN